MLGVVAFVLFVSGVTVWPAILELKFAVSILWGDCIPLRGLPSYWFWIDLAFAPGAAIPLIIALRDIRKRPCHGRDITNIYDYNAVYLVY